MSKDYRSMLPSGDSQMQGGNSETGGRHDSPRKQEKPHTILQVVNKVKALFHGGQKRAKLYDQKGLTSCMEWFPIVYHLADKVALVVFPVLAYYTGKFHLNDTMTLTSLTFFTLGRVQASLTLLSLTQKVPLGDGLYADLCLVSNLGHQ